MLNIFGKRKKRNRKEGMEKEREGLCMLSGCVSEKECLVGLPSSTLTLFKALSVLIFNESSQKRFSGY